MNTAYVADFGIVQTIIRLRKELKELLKLHNNGSVLTEFTPNFDIPFSPTNLNRVTLGIANSQYHNDSSRKVHVSMEPQISTDRKTVLPVLVVSYERMVPGKMYALTTTRHYMPRAWIGFEQLMECHATKRLLDEQLTNDVFGYLVDGTSAHLETVAIFKDKPNEMSIKMHALKSIGENIFPTEVAVF